MNVISYKAVAKFARKHADSLESLDAWYDLAKDLKASNIEELKRVFRPADRFGACVIFDIGGNNYRLIAWVNYRTQTIFIRRILTHAEYDRNKWKGEC